MAALAEASIAAPRRRASVARFLAWHPEWWVYALAGLAAAWLALPVVVDAVTGAVGAHPHDHPGHAHTGAHAGDAPVDMAAGSGAPVSSAWSALAAWSDAWQRWTVMVAAMMLPVVATQVRGVAVRSVWSRRHRSALAFLVGFLAVWFAVGGLAVAIPVAGGSPAPSGLWTAGALLLAAGWHVSPVRRRVLRRCGAVRLGPTTGSAADLDCARAGLRSGLRCVVTCGPMMVAMVVSHSLLLMVGLLVVMLSERSRGPDPLRRAGRLAEASALLGFAVLAGAWAAVQ